MTLSAISHHGSGSGVFPALVFVQGNDQKSIVLNRTPFSVGRKVDKDLVIADPRVSRDHAQIVLEGDDFYLIDQGSKHGTFVNGERIQRQKLERNDRLEFGARELKRTVQRNFIQPVAALVAQGQIPPASTVLLDASKTGEFNILLRQ